MPLPTVSAEKKPWVIGICLLVVLGSLWSILKPGTGGQGLSKAQVKNLESTAAFSAEAVADFAGGQGNVVVISLEISGSQGLLESRKAFLRVLEEKGLNVVAEEIVKPTVDSPYFFMPGWHLPLESVLEAARKHTDIEWIVSLAGAPDPAEVAEARLPEGFPRFVLGTTIGAPADLRGLFDSGLLSMAIIKQPQGGIGKGTESETARARFERTYRVVTAESTDLPKPVPVR